MDFGSLKDIGVLYTQIRGHHDTIPKVGRVFQAWIGFPAEIQIISGRIQVEPPQKNCWYFKFAMVFTIWVFPKVGENTQHGWLKMENPIKMDDLVGKPTILGNPHIVIIVPSLRFTFATTAAQLGSCRFLSAKNIRPRNQQKYDLGCSPRGKCRGKRLGSRTKNVVIPCSDWNPEVLHPLTYVIWHISYQYFGPRHLQMKIPFSQVAPRWDAGCYMCRGLNSPISFTEDKLIKTIL